MLVQRLVVEHHDPSPDPERLALRNELEPILSDVSVGAPVPEKALEGGSEELLVVEDDDQVRALTVEMLQGLGYRVVVAPNDFAASSNEVRVRVLDS